MLAELQPGRFWQSPPGTSALYLAAAALALRSSESDRVREVGRKELAPQQRGSRAWYYFRGRRQGPSCPSLRTANPIPGLADAAVGVWSWRVSALDARDRRPETPRGGDRPAAGMLSRAPGSFAVRLEDITLASDREGFRTYN